MEANPLTVNLRYFNSRFNINFIMCNIRALDIANTPGMIDTHSMVLWVEPRPHKEKGSRFRFKDAEIVTHAAMIEMAASMGDMIKATLKQNEVERARAKRESGGSLDYTLMLVIATNTGPDKLPGDIAPTMR